MPTGTLRIGIIGVGQIGQVHLQVFQEMPGVEVAAIAGRDPGRTEKVARDYQVGFWTTDFRELLARPELKGVCVCLHNNLHMPVSVAALEMGKHVFCEKPMAGSYRDAAAMLAAARRSGKNLTIQLASLFEIETRAARAAIAEGWLGKPYFAFCAGFRRRGRPYVDGYGSPAFVQKSQAAGGALYDMGVYHLAALLYLLDNPKPLRICGRTFQETPIDPQRLQESGYDVEEFATALVQLEGDLALNLVEAWAAHLDQIGGSYLLGSLGGLRLKPFGLFRSLGDLDLDARADLQAYATRLQRLRPEDEALRSPQAHWIAALQGRTSPLPTAEIALNAMLISEGVYLSSRLGREVTAQEVMQSSSSNAEGM